MRSKRIKGGPRVEEKRQPVIQVKNLYKIFRVGDEKVRALNGVDLTTIKESSVPFVGTPVPENPLC